MPNKYMLLVASSLVRSALRVVNPVTVKCDNVGIMARVFGAIFLCWALCSKHDEVRTFVCVECHKAFPTNADLTRHKKREKKIGLKCDICGVTVAGKTDLQEHLDSHSREKNYRCEECGRVYKYRRNLSRHMKSHKKD
ncbi:zinc finger protein 626-like [Mercenaria mercenaria]|uniref:zinc finger protein 626-like n=1 Tax=Mercenaria mercenaria TaxID=6596 RepID=UPI00234F76D6|nr:zinc finger protein 626-like [Mercenaria mercenaria]